MLPSMQAEGFCRSVGGQSITFPPTVPFLSPAALLTAAQVREGAKLAYRSPANFSTLPLHARTELALAKIASFGAA
jgi:hypothetical protein